MKPGGRLGSTVIGTLLLASCATGRGGGSMSPLLSSSWRPAPGQDCTLVSTPTTLPQAEELLSSEAVRSLLEQQAHGSADGDPYAVLEVRFDSLGNRSRVRVLETNMGPEGVERIVQNIAGQAPPSAHSAGRAWGVLLRTQNRPDAPEVRVGRMEYCACAVINRDQITRRLYRLAEESPVPGLQGRHQITIEVQTDSTGAILERRLHRSTGSVAVDRLIVRAVGEMQVAPPLMNRRPVEAWSRLPIIIDFRDRTPRTLEVRDRRGPP